VAEGEARLFVAVPLPPEAVAACTTLIDEVRRGPLGRVPRWVQLSNLHLTVRFLGETPPERVTAVAEAVEAAVRDRESFDVVLARAGSFPDGRRPRTLWLGIERGADELGGLATAVGAAIEPLGWPPEDRPYRPHLTVARLDAARGGDGTTVADALRAAARDWRVGFRADRVVLFRSHLGGGPPRHEPLVTVPLA
jgi:RNA 2',3'-cyclic 3'-phosphodiesterase